MNRNYLFDSRLFYCFLHIILFFYIYSIQFVGVPFAIGTRVFMGIIGFLIFIYDIFNIKFNLIIKKSFIQLFLNIFSIIFVSLFTIIYNQTSDFEFLFKYPISIIIIIFASYFVTKLTFLKTIDVGEVPILFRLIINVVIIQIVIALIMFSLQPLRDFINSIQVVTDFELKVLDETSDFRLVGFGSKFFGSGIINGFTLILIGSIIKFNSPKKIDLFKYTISFFIIFVFGMMMARTTIVGALFALAIILTPGKIFIFDVRKIKTKFIFFFYLLITPIVSYFVLSLFFRDVNKSLELAFNFGFEIFVNYFQSNSIETESTNQLQEMFIWPNEVKTYLIGDGHFTDLLNGGYYKETDIGILRLIYYFGISGLLMYFIFQFQVIYIAVLNLKKYKTMFLVLFLYLLVLNLKGFTDIFFLIILFGIKKPVNARKQTSSCSYS